MNKFYYFLCAIWIFTSGCKAKEMLEKMGNIQRVISFNCDCDKAIVLGYYEHFFRTKLSVQVIGADTTKRIEIANKINYELDKEISDYCNIDEFRLEFINNDKHKIITIRNCQIEE